MNQLNLQELLQHPDTMAIDPYRSKALYLRWKHANAAGIPGICTESSRSIKSFIADMEAGRNIGRGTKRGGRSYVRLNTLRIRLVVLAKMLADRFGDIALTAVTESQIHDLFVGMRTGEIKKRNGGTYRSTGDYVKVFRSFWHWHMKVQRKRGVVLDDICIDIDSSTEKPPWVYLTHREFEKLCNHAKHEYRVLMTFLFDSGIRSPTELVNVRVHDLLEDCRKLRIRDETAKTFGRTINLLLSAALLRDHIRERGLGPDDQVFPICAAVVNRYLKRLATRVLGTQQTRGGASYAEVTMYDFRHSSACYWLPRYNSENALKYRFGWKRSEMIHYYTEFLGMKDTITGDDLVTAPERSAIEQHLEQTEREKRVLEEKVRSLQDQIDTVLRTVEAIAQKTK